MGGRLRHAPTGTRGAKASLLATEGHQHLVFAGVTTQPQKAVGQDATLEIGVKLLPDVSGQTFGGGVSFNIG
jgi:hypothetical protein